MKKIKLLFTFSLILVLVFNTFTPVSAKSTKLSIPEDAFQYKGHYYYYYGESMSWEEAEEECEKLGGHLVTFSGENEESMVWGYVKKFDTPAWIGLCNEGFIDIIYKSFEDDWKWVTGEKVKYTNWAKNQPNHQYYDFEKSYDQYVAIGKGNEVTTSDVDAKTPSWGDFDGIYSVTSGTIKGYICEWDIYEIEVTNAPKSIKKGKSITLDVKVYDTAGHKLVSNAKVSYKSSKKSVATVSKKGKVKAKKKGSCTITITYKGCTQKVSIKVK